MAESLINNLSSLNPFSTTTKFKKPLDADDVGESLGPDAIAGGGHSARPTAVTKSQLRVSDALKQFLVKQSVITPAEALQDYADRSSTLQRLLDLPHIQVPSSLTDRSYSLPEYFISSSHNTYLEKHQLVGSSSADAYRTALNTGSRCVEIDAWDSDNPEEPKVTHGYTLVSHVSFRSVCEVIRDVYDVEAREQVDAQGYRAAPILISLENHCGERGQLRLVRIMKEVFGDRLLSEAVRREGHEEQVGGDHITLAELGSKIVVIVEHHLPGEPEDSSSSDSSSDEDEKQAKQEYKKQAKNAPSTVIVPELADLGVYAQSVKPSNNSWFEELSLRDGPHHHLINVSESGLATHLPQHSVKIAKHNSQHLMRVYPKGTRISSKNLNPVPFWGIGAQINALNWQTFGAGIQVNEALFAGSDGYVLKPAALRAGGSGNLSTGRQKRLRLHVAGATDVPITKDHDEGEIKPYVTCSLLHPSTAQPTKKKTLPYKQHKLSGYLNKLKGDEELNPIVTEPIWDEVLEWTYEENELVFLRILVKSDDSFKANPILAVGAVRLEYVVKREWRFVRLLDLHGRETRCSLLVRFEIEDV